MVERTYSEQWHRVEQLRPRLAPHVHVGRQRLRGREWFVLHDETTGKSFRMSPEAFEVVRRFNGRRSLADIWEGLRSPDNSEDSVTSQDEVIRLLGQLHKADMLIVDAAGNITERVHRRRKRKRDKWVSQLANPLALRIPLFDPDRLLGRLMSFSRPLLGWAGLAAWCVAMAWLIVMAGVHWDELTRNIGDRILSGQNIMLMAVCYPLLKLVHELGHGLLVKKCGGEVHVLGVMLLVMMPVPYVDASAASAFRLARQRALVGLAGVMAETWIAAGAMWVWLHVSGGVVHAAAYTIMLLVLVSSLLFNLNPLLRFDAYYVVSDLLGMPNLAQRANAYAGYLMRRYLFGVRSARTPATGPGEEAWLLLYAVASFAYRVFLCGALTYLLAGKYFVFGLVLAAWLVVVMFLFPLARSLRNLWLDPEMQKRRGKALSMLGGGALAGFVVFFWIPFPHWMVAQGVIWPPEGSRLVAGASGFVRALHVKDGEHVQRGQSILDMVAPELRARQRILKAQLEAMAVEHRDSMLGDRLVHAKTAQEINHLRDRLRDINDRISALTILSRQSGVMYFRLPWRDLPGRYLPKGALIGHVLGADEAPLVRVLVSHDRIEDFLVGLKGVEVRLPHAEATYPARLIRLHPEALREIPSLALTREGGGEIDADMRDKTRPVAVEPLFQLDVSYPEAAGFARIGERAYVKFRFVDAPLGQRLLKWVRRTFLGRSHV